MMFLTFGAVSSVFTGATVGIWRILNSFIIDCVIRFVRSPMLSITFRATLPASENVLFIISEVFFIILCDDSSTPFDAAFILLIILSLTYFIDMSVSFFVRPRPIFNALLKLSRNRLPMLPDTALICPIKSEVTSRSSVILPTLSLISYTSFLKMA